MIKLGLTGSIGMGKSTTALMFAELGCVVWDADAAVKRLYDSGGKAVEAIRSLVPKAIIDNAVSRDILRAEISKNRNLLKEIENHVHPLVRQDRERFIQDQDADIGVFDIPLLFETGSQNEFDAVACVFVDFPTQKERVLSRGTMNEEQFLMILAKQMPIEEKAKRSDFIIDTSSLETARTQVSKILTELRSRTVQ